MLKKLLNLKFIAIILLALATIFSAFEYATGAKYTCIGLNYLKDHGAESLKDDIEDACNG